MAGQRLTDKTALEEQLGTGDLFMVVDVNDTTGSSAGTSKKYDTKFLMQTDKISVSNAELQAMDATGNAGTFKTLVGALSGYMITVFNVNCLVTHNAVQDTSLAGLYLGYKSNTTSSYWGYGRRFYTSDTSDITATFTGASPQSGTCGTSILNKPFLMWASTNFNGNWSMDVYVTYCYTKVL